MTTRAVLLATAIALPAVGRAETPRFFELEGFGHFLDGNPESTAVTEEGAVALPPEVHERLSDAAASFSAATSRGDDVIVARVDDGQVGAISPAGKFTPLYKPEANLVTALLSTPEGLLVATGPQAKVYRVDKAGKATVHYTAEANYVWGMAAGPDGAVYAVTGEPGTVVKISKQGKAETLFKPDQAHLRSVAYDAKLGLFVGGGERGVLYRAARGDDFRALYDTSNPEITAILVRDDAVYVAGVTGAAALAQDDGGKKGKPLEVRSQVMRVAMDGTSEVLAGSSDEAVFDLAFDNQGHVLVATGATGRDDPRGRLYSIDAPRRMISLLYQSPSRRLTALVNLPHGAVAAVAAGGGRVVELTGTAAAKGEFLTQAFDTGINSKFGLVQVLGLYPKGSGVDVAVRTGQTAEPDDSWSAWSKEIEAPGNRAVQVPNGRYVQARLTLKSKSGVTPLVQRLRVAYLRQNLAPFVREVSAMHKGIALLPMPKEEIKPKVVPVNDKSDDAGESRHAQARARQVLDRGALTLKWVADDPNGDELRYDLMVRAAGDATWRLLKDDLEDPFYTFKSSQLPDGHYQFRVRASDARSNPDGLDRSDARESRAVLVDNTPPQVAPIKVSAKGRQAQVRTQVSDAVGPLVELTYALDSGDPRPIMPADGVLDGPEEDVTFELRGLGPGTHILTVRAVDEADNEGFGEARFELP